MRFDREDKSLLANWWFTVDRILLTAIFMLMGVGIIVSLAASPSVAINKDLAAFYFVKRHVIVVSFGAVLMLLLSAQSPRTIRRVALVLYIISIGTMIYVLAAGEEINGARRWLRVAGVSLQPSELAKPALVVLSAWAFAEYERRRDVPALPVAIGLYIVFVTLLLMQPDVGQSLLITLVWGAIFVLAGLAVVWAVGLISLALAGLGGAYFMLPYVQNRVHAFLFPVSGDNSQIERAFNSFKVGGFFGRGPGEGTIKTVLPDAHTDFIFAVIAEEYGVVACLALLALFMFIVFRALIQAVASEDLSMRYAVCGLALLIGGQALINIHFQPERP